MNQQSMKDSFKSRRSLLNGCERRENENLSSNDLELVSSSALDSGNASQLRGETRISPSVIEEDIAIYSHGKCCSTECTNVCAQAYPSLMEINWFFCDVVSKMET